MSRELTPTSFALLGLLNIQPFSAYDLTNQMKRGMGTVWPRAERAIYDEPKRLVEQGLATGRTEAQGKRSRTVYSITKAGRTALQEWLATAPAPVQIEIEHVLRATFANSGEVEDLRATARTLIEQAEEVAEIVRVVAPGYVEGAGLFPERAHLVIASGAFLVEYSEMLRRYGQWLLDATEEWDGTGTGAWPGVREAFADLLKRVEPD